MHGLAIHDEVIIEESACLEVVNSGFKPLKGLSEHFNVDFGFICFMGVVVVVMGVSVIGVLVEFALKMAGEGCAAIM